MKHGLRFGGLALVAALSACAPPPGGTESAPSPRNADSPSVETGGISADRPGRLRQDDVTVEFNWQAVRIQVTPLEDWVLEATAPDTKSRLSRLAEEHGDPTEPGLLLLVSFFTLEDGTPFEPEFLMVRGATGSLARPERIVPLTPSWSSRRLRMRKTETAVYRFPAGIDISREMVVEYEGVANHQWRSIVPRIQAERR